MRSHFPAVFILSLAVLFSTVPAAHADHEDTGDNMVTKLGRGAINTITGWVEIPKKISEEWEESGPAAGFTWGLVKGFSYGFVRTAAGLYELVTFPFPAPPGYGPIMEPEFVFSDEEADYEDHP